MQSLFGDLGSSYSHSTYHQKSLKRGTTDGGKCMDIEFQTSAETFGKSKLGFGI